MHSETAQAGDNSCVLKEQETKEDEVEEVRKILKEEMMGAADLKVPLSIDIEEGKTWYEAK